MNNSTAATDLGLIGGRYDTATTSWIGEDRAKVRVNNLFNALILLDEKLDPVPDLATRWTTSPDGLTYSFELAQMPAGMMGAR